VLALAILYVITDIVMFRRGMGLAILYGQFALTAYLISHLPFKPALSALADTLAQGMPRLFGPAPQPFLLQVVTVICLTFALLVRRAVKSRD
jgi:hypothetical protein